MCLPAPRFVDRAPAKIVVTLLDEGHYLCSEQMMYRKLATHRSLRHSPGRFMVSLCVVGWSVLYVWVLEMVRFPS